MAMIPVIDLFAGPGGLNEGFSQFGENEGAPRFKTVASFEMESSACHTLLLRGAYRHLLRAGWVPDSYYRFIRGELDCQEFRSIPEIASALAKTHKEVHQVELGVDRKKTDDLIRSALGETNDHKDPPWVLIGGPPCQAYSLAGRSRRAHDKDFESDIKHFLYREYLHILAKFSPPVFVMENVKGLLSSSHAGIPMFQRIKKDLEEPAEGLYYDVHSLTVDGDLTKLRPSDFLIRSENYGIPQKRHRVILVGVRRDFVAPAGAVGKLNPSAQVSVMDAIGALPELRSGVSPARLDDAKLWRQIQDEVAEKFGDNTGLTVRSGVELSRGSPFVRAPLASRQDSTFQHWISDPRIGGYIQHESRGHMSEDLKRYWYAANTAKRTNVSPKLRDYPDELLPHHKNARQKNRPFDDRFRVQVGDFPASTVVSHIAKDGHYYIHPDPDQMRSLTVREAARLQSFPDNYFFMGNRTQQYHQVGNAVPPLLAHQIAHVVAAIFDDA